MDGGLTTSCLRWLDLDTLMHMLFLLWTYIQVFPSMLYVTMNSVSVCVSHCGQQRSISCVGAPPCGRFKNCCSCKDKLDWCTSVTDCRGFLGQWHEHFVFIYTVIFSCYINHSMLNMNKLHLCNSVSASDRGKPQIMCVTPPWNRLLTTSGERAHISPVLFSYFGSWLVLDLL